MISKRRYWFLVFMVVLVYIAGMFVTLFENDSAQFAVMAMRMVQENDFLSLFKGPNEYLDKPHMHYWLAALSFKIFGLYDWAYRIPGILSTFLAAYSCYGLGKLLYNTDTGKIAALIFMTAQTIVLSVIDVRTDAVLTGFTIFAIWQLTTYIETNHIKHIILGAFGAGIAFSTKGQIAIVVIGLPLLCHLSYTRKWGTLFNWKAIIALLIFAITITPILYAYYHQFDLHPEKIIRGKSNRSGIFFILWEQSFERMSGEGIGKNSSDYFFFFHTFLWVFIPWTIIALTGFGSRIKTFFKLKFAYNSKYEFLTIGGITLIFILISFAQFKLPHYLNITIPLFSILSASYLLCFFVFKLDNVLAYVLLSVVGLSIIYYSLKLEAYYLRIITLSVFSSVLLNAVLNLHLYPSLLEYQAGSAMAETIAENKIPVDKIYKISDSYTWSLDFYNQKPVIISSVEAIKDKKDIWVYANDKQLELLKKAGLDWDQQLSENQFRITRLQAKFMNPATRKRVLKKRYLIHIY